MPNNPRAVTGPKKVLALALVFVLASFGMSVSAFSSEAAESTIFTEVKVAAYGACALNSVGSVSCWGSLINTPMPEEFKPVKHLALVEDHFACVITMNDEFKCWFDRSIGYGDWNDGKSHSTPGVIAKIPKSLGPVKQIASSEYNSICAIKMDNSVHCWGGFWNQDELRVPDSLGQVEKIGSLSGGYCALNSTSQLKCWGFEPLSTWRCNVTADGVVKCWDVEGQTTFDSEFDLVEDFYSGHGNICVSRNAGSTADSYFCLGSSKNPVTNMPLEYSALTDLKHIEVGNYIACAITAQDEILCWGEDYFDAAKVPLISGGYKAVSIGLWLTCSVTIDGKILCWGDKRHETGKLRFGPPTINPAPTIIPGGDIGTTGLDFTWKNIANNLQIDSYHLEMRSVGGSWKKVKISGSAGSIQTLDKLKASSSYELRMRSKNKAGYSAFSMIYSVKTLSSCPYSLVSRKVDIEKRMKYIRRSLASSRNLVIEARAYRVRVQRFLRNFKDYSKIPAMQALVNQRDAYERKMFDALNNGDIGLAARSASQMEGLEQTISKLLGPYPVIKAQIQDAYDYEKKRTALMQAVAQKLSQAQGDLDLLRSKCA